MKIRVCLLALALVTTGLAPIVVRAQGATSVAGIDATDVGVHGPTHDIARGFDVIGHADLNPAPELATSKPLGNNGGIALIGDCAYVGRWHDYSGKNPVQIIDVALGSPTYMRVIGGVKDSSVAGSVSREIRAIDLPGLKMLTVLTFAQATGDRTHNKLLFFTIPAGGSCADLRLTGTFDMASFRGHEFFQWLDPNPAHNVNGHPRILEYITTPIGPGNILVVDASDPAAPKLLSAYQDAQPVASPTEKAGTGLGTYAHSISLSPNGTTAFVSDWDGGFFTLDASTFAAGVPGGALVPRGAMSTPLHYGIDSGTGLPAFGNTHSAALIPGTNTVAVGDEIYASTDGCPFGWMRLIDVGDATRPAAQIGEFRLPENHASACAEQIDPARGPLEGAPLLLDRNADGKRIDGTFSMHNQTAVGGFVLATWYGGGLRAVDVRDPAHPVEAAMFVPQPVGAIKSSPDTSAPVYGTDTDLTNDWWVAMWSYPVVRDGIVYVSDMRSGLYALRPTAPALRDAVDASRFAEGNSNFGTLVP